MALVRSDLLPDSAGVASPPPRRPPRHPLGSDTRPGAHTHPRQPEARTGACTRMQRRDEGGRACRRSRWPHFGRIDDGPVVEAVSFGASASAGPGSGPSDSFCQARPGHFRGQDVRGEPPLTGGDLGPSERPRTRSRPCALPARTAASDCRRRTRPRDPAHGVPGAQEPAGRSCRRPAPAPSSAPRQRSVRVAFPRARDVQLAVPCRVPARSRSCRRYRCTGVAQLPQPTLGMAAWHGTAATGGLIDR